MSEEFYNTHRYSVDDWRLSSTKSLEQKRDANILYVRPHLTTWDTSERILVSFAPDPTVKLRLLKRKTDESMPFPWWLRRECCPLPESSLSIFLGYVSSSSSFAASSTAATVTSSFSVIIYDGNTNECYYIARRIRIVFARPCSLKMRGTTTRAKDTIRQNDCTHGTTNDEAPRTSRTGLSPK